MTGLLALEAVSKSFSGVRAVEDVSLSVPGSAIVAIAGPNGAGKTTLLDLIAGVHRPDAGTIRLGGTDIAGLPPHRACGLGIARTFQRPRPFPGMTIEDNVVVAALLREPEMAIARRRALEALEPLGLAAACGLPAAGLDMSGRKRLDLARALATRPRLLLLDEPLAGLSAVDHGAMIDFLRALKGRRGLSILLTERDPGVAALLTDRIVLLDHGEIVETLSVQVPA